MYERNAIVIDRYFAEMFGYEEKNNLKNNYKNYNELVSKLEEYQNISKEEDQIMIEYEKTANEIRDTQKAQESLYKRCLKLQETRENLFGNLDESIEILQKKFAKIEDEIEKNNTEIKSNSEKFVENIGDFNQKSEERTKCGRERRVVESDYQKILSDTIANFNGINQEKLEVAKQFFKQEDVEELKAEIKGQISKNGAREKVPFNTDVISSAIDVATDVEKRKIEILLMTYEKTARILNEIKNDATKIEKHKKYLKDSDSKLKFLNMISEYVILFLDNERMSVVGGEKEHKNLMDEACQNLEKDIEQIENLYDLLVKEIAGKSTKKAYKEQYNPEYLQDLLEDQKQFENSISKLNVVGTIIYPSYWRVEGMQKIYETFKTIISDIYDKDLSEYEPLDMTTEENPIEDIQNDTIDDDDDEFDWGEDFYSDDSEEDDEEDIEEDEDFDLDLDDLEDADSDNDNDWEDDETEADEWADEDEDEDEDEDDEWADNELEDDEDYDDETENDSKDNIDDEDDEDRVIDEILGFYNNTSENDDSDIDDDFELDEEDNSSDEDFDDIDLDWEEDDEEVVDEEKVVEEKKTNKGKSKKKK